MPISGRRVSPAMYSIYFDCVLFDVCTAYIASSTLRYYKNNINCPADQNPPSNVNLEVGSSIDWPFVYILSSDRLGAKSVVLRTLASTNKICKYISVGSFLYI